MSSHPEWGTRPKVGLKPTTPQRAAGILTDPNYIMMKGVYT
jgi:hypothetical protein